MESSSQPKSGLAKAVAFSAILLLVSLGLCGLNALAMSAIHSDSQFLFATAFLETAGIVLGLAGLLLFGFFAIVNAIYLHLSKSSAEDDRP